MTDLTKEVDDKFWYDDIKILFTNLDDFYPSYDMSLVQKLNAITRLALYIGVILTVVTFNHLYLYIPVAIGLFTIFVYYNQKDNIEKFFTDYDRFNCAEEKPCTKPTTDNPFMNFNQITDDRYRAPACKSYNNDEIKKDIEEKFGYNLYRDVGDLYGKSNGELIWNTVPNTTAVNDQTSFAKWLYNTGPTAKEDAIRGAPQWSAIATNQIFERFANN